MPLPSSLFKFERFTTQALSNLKEQVIYFSSPRNFNDPYDCSIKNASSARRNYLFNFERSERER